MRRDRRPLDLANFTGRVPYNLARYRISETANRGEEEKEEVEDGGGKKRTERTDTQIRI